MSILSIDDAINYLDINLGNNDQDQLEMIVAGVQADFETICNRSFDSATYTEYHDGVGNDRLHLEQFPVTSITGVYEDTSREWEASSEVDSDDYFLVDESVIMRKSGLFTVFPQAIKVVYVAGYSSVTMPSDLKMACIDEVVRRYRQQYKNMDTGVGSRTEEGITTSYITNHFLDSTERVLELYTLKRVF